MRTPRRRAEVPVVNERGVNGAGTAFGMTFVPGTHMLVVGGHYGGVALVDADRATVVKQLRGHAKSYRIPSGEVTDNPIWTPGVSADGRLLATTSADGTVNLWSLPDGRRLGAPIECRNGARDGQLSPDGRWLSVQALDERVFQDRIEVWNVRARRRARVLWLAGGVSYSRFSPDGRLLAIGDLQRRVHLYSTKTWAPATGFVLDADAVWAASAPTRRCWRPAVSTEPCGFSTSRTDRRSARSRGGSTAVPMFLPGDVSPVAGQDDGTTRLWTFGRLRSRGARASSPGAGSRTPSETRRSWAVLTPRRAEHQVAFPAEDDYPHRVPSKRDPGLDPVPSCHQAAEYGP